MKVVALLLALACQLMPTLATSQEFEPGLRSIRALFRLMKEKHNLDLTCLDCG